VQGFADGFKKQIIKKLLIGTQPYIFDKKVEFHHSSRNFMDKMERKLDRIFKLSPRGRAKKEETHKWDVSLIIPKGIDNAEAVIVDFDVAEGKAATIAFNKISASICQR
jgi:hypothetical protein